MATLIPKPNMTPIMKRLPNLPGKIAILSLLAAPMLSAQTFNWGTPAFSDFRNSTGTPLDQSFTVQLGIFVNSFIPSAENAGDWAANWRTLDTAGFDASLGYATGTFDLLADGSSTGINAAAGSFFSGMVYIWVFDTTDATGGAEWFLARNDAWVTPATNEDCCGGTPTQWSTSDLGNNNVPVVGAHDNIIGGGSAAAPGVYDLQTYSVVAVPEPTALAFLVLSAGICMRRRRSSPDES